MDRRKVFSPRVLALLGVVIILPFCYWYISLKAPSLPDPPLKELAAKHSIQLGVHALENRLDDRVYPSVITSQFSFIAMDAEAHFKVLQPKKGVFDFSSADSLIAFAKKHNMPVQGHHLVWGEHNLLPKWLVDGNYNKQQLLDVLHDHIIKTVQHFRGRVAQWTVINEEVTRSANTYGLKDWWYDRLGGDTSYMDKAFIWAHQADPKATLLINDFNNEYPGKISDATFKYITSAKNRGVPIDGVGMQMHVSGANPPSKQAVIDNMQRYASIGVPVYVTEFDVNVNSVKGSLSRKAEVEARVTYDMVRACIEAKNCVSFVEFGITDKNNFYKWLTKADSHSYLFDSRFRPKPSFKSFVDAWQQP